MITLKDNKTIQQASEEHRVSPNEHVWLRLEKKLVANKANRKIKWYKTALAASTILLIMCTLLLYNTKNHPSELNRMTGEINDYKTEELFISTASNEIFYSTDKIGELKQAYNKLGINGKG